MDLVLLLVCVTPVVQCYSSGLVMDGCNTMQPHHSGLIPQMEPSPFTVTAEASRYRPGQDIRVQLQATTSTPFTGFLLQARKVAGSSPVGFFTVLTGASQLLTCSQRSNSAVSHTSKCKKKYIQVTWRSNAAGGLGDIQFHASFVLNYSTFWVDVRSRVVSFNNNTNDESKSFFQRKGASNATQAVILPNVSRTDCGVTKVCITQPSNCEPAVSAHCYFMSARIWPPNGTAVHYEMAGPSDGYISFGLSDDQRMGNDDIYICGLDSHGLMRLQHAFSTGREAPEILPLGNVSDVRASVQNGIMTCSFTSMNPVSTQRTSGNKKIYYLLFAHGPSQNGQIQLHTGTFFSMNRIDISQPVLIQKAGWPQIIKAHGALMLIAWMTTGSLGIMVARYLRGVAKEQPLYGKDVWFVIHVAVMSVTVAATTVAFILPFVDVKSWAGGAHPVLGCLVMIFSFLQSTVALLRCGPQHPLRFLFDWSHCLNAVAIKALAVAAIFTGLRLIDISINQWLMKVIGGCVAWEALFYILFEVHMRWRLKITGTIAPPRPEKVLVNMVLIIVFSAGNLSFLVTLLVGIGTS